MPSTLGYHVVKSCYGLWLPGDERGSWSDAWDKRIGYVEPHTLHPGDPARKRMAEERMKHSPVRLSLGMIEAVAEAVGECVIRSDGGLSIAAASIEATHMHLLIPYSGRDIDKTAKWLSDRSTKSVHQSTDHNGPVWCKGKWRSFIFERRYWRSAKLYIERHNERRGLGRAPFSFVDREL